MKFLSLSGSMLVIIMGIWLVVCSPSTMNTNDQISYLALGDSYTIGESVGDDERYPVQLTEALRSRGIDMLDPVVIATTGWTTLDLKSAMDNANLEGRTFDLVSLLIGVNDQYQGKIFEEYGPNFRMLLRSAIALAGGNPEKVFVISIPDYAFTPFGQQRNTEKITRELNAYNATNKLIADQYNVSYFDITPISRLGLEDPTLVATDGLHPSAEMYKRWVQSLIDDVYKKLTR
ncbi:MAG: SGNH/GDSL hydrolase family protein [Saprospiraceae bacterium]|nr:SGNH/GDSL hydrolase family protein [Saprospiraceae bacterium]